MNGKIEFTKGQIKTNREETMAIEKKIDQTRTEISLIHESLMRIKEEIISQVSNIDEDLHNQLANIRINLNSMNEKLKTDGMRIANHSDELESQRKSIEDHSHTIKSIEISIQSLSENKLNKEVYEKEIARCISEIQKVSYGMQDLHRNIQATDNYLEKYFPVTLQNYITETISNVIENKKVLGRLLEYDIGKHILMSPRRYFIRFFKIWNLCDFHYLMSQLS
jgi:chromosome segregation ATPase